MSAPKMIAKLRVKDKVPFSIETLSGKQFRCGVCGKIFYSRDELDRHLPLERNKLYNNLQFPEWDKNITIGVIYTQDVRDITNPKYPKLKEGDKLFKR